MKLGDFCDKVADALLDSNFEDEIADFIPEFEGQITVVPEGDYGYRVTLGTNPGTIFEIQIREVK